MTGHQNQKGSSEGVNGTMTLAENGQNEGLPEVVGVDPARQGKDCTEISVQQDGVVSLVDTTTREWFDMHLARWVVMHFEDTLEGKIERRKWLARYRKRHGDEMADKLIEEARRVWTSINGDPKKGPQLENN